jgi:hypothetical protein
MKNASKALITLVLLAAFASAAYFSFFKTGQIAGTPAGRLLGTTDAVELTGLIALDVEPYFQDERVIQALAAQGFKVSVKRVGSRDMANSVGGSDTPDFFFPSGVLAANQIADAAKRANVGSTSYSPFYTPMVIASWAPIARILAANDMASETSPKVWRVDLAKLTQAMLNKKRWKDLKDSASYDVNKSVLVSTTDVRKSNSAAMYLALTGYAINGNDVVADRASAQKVAKRVLELFKRQGYQENYVNGNFDDYAAIGIGKTPLAFIYENQMLSYALAKKGVGPDMVLMYPQPTLFNKVVFVATSERAKKLGEALASNPQLQRLAVEYGFRIADTAQFMQVAQGAGLAVEERITQVIDPPSYELMGEMIDVITHEMVQ